MTEQTARIEATRLARERGLQLGACTIGRFHDVEGDYLIRVDTYDGSPPIRVYFDSTEKEQLPIVFAT